MQADTPCSAIGSSSSFGQVQKGSEELVVEYVVAIIILSVYLEHRVGQVWVEVCKCLSCRFETPLIGFRFARLEEN